MHPQPLLEAVIGAVGSKTLHDFRAQCAKPDATQESVLREILRANADSAYGRDRGLPAVRAAAEFRARVPVNTYQDLQPYIHAALNGEPSQLTREKPVLFATTSGTTGTPKYIPVTPTSKKAKSKLVRVWVSGLHRDHPAMFRGKTLSVVSPEVESHAPCGTPCGAESGHGYKDIPAAMATMYSQPYEVFGIKDYDAKYYTLLRIAAGQQISFMYSCNPSTILLIAQRMGQHTEEIIRDVRDGTLSASYDIPPEVRSLVASGLSADPERARFLEQAASAGDGVLYPRHVWPELAVIGCWKGGTVGMYVEKFGQYYREDVGVRDMGWLASEVRGSVPLSDQGPAGVLAIATNFFEFRHLDAEEGGDLLGAGQLEEGQRYFVYVTTHGGLYRYDMNDILEVTGFYEQTPLVRFVQKGKGVVSFTGEKLYEAQILEAVEQAFAPLQGSYHFITALGAMAGDRPRYTFLVEFDQRPGEGQAQRLLVSLEKDLRAQNIEYGSKRDSGRIGAPALRGITQGAFDAYRRREVDKGRNDGQFKIMRLTTDTALADALEADFEITLEQD